MRLPQKHLVGYHGEVSSASESSLPLRESATATSCPHSMTSRVPNTYNPTSAELFTPIHELPFLLEIGVEEVLLL